MSLRERLKSTCEDISGGDRCERDPHDDGLHRRGPHTWGSRDPFVPTWLRLARQRANGLARDDTGRGAAL